ncbi:uncharacterized protein METZ01_LOCUS399515, partial [marine metagenome]
MKIFLLVCIYHKLYPTLQYQTEQVVYFITKILITAWIIDYIL